MFRADRTGRDGDIITRASVSDGEDKTKAREGREEWCSAGHGELQLRRGLDSDGKRNVATTSVHQPNGMMDELEEAMAELWAN